MNADELNVRLIKCVAIRSVLAPLMLIVALISNFVSHEMAGGMLLVVVLMGGVALNVVIIEYRARKALNALIA